LPEQRIEADVCVIGAGFAGLTAGRRLAQAGRSVIVVEARDRVGGRVWTRRSAAGVAIDMGGTFVGPQHDRVHALADEVGVSTFATHTAGDTILATGGRVRRYRGDVPRINPLGLVSAGQAIARLDAMARKVPVDAPWEAPKAASWDARTIRSWLTASNVPTRTARDLLETTVRALFCCDLSEVSLLNLLFLIRSAGGLGPLMTIEGGYQQDQFVGGAQSVADAMAADLGDSLVLDAPVHAVSQRGDAVEVTSRAAIVKARDVVISIPPALASRLSFDPPLPADRALLLHQLPAGTEIKAVAVYDEAFWRDDGLSGASVATDAPFEVTLDTSPPSGEAGVIACYASGPKARQLAALRAEDRRAIVADLLRTRFGARASSPIELLEQHWADEEWTRGCSMAHFGPGVLTQYGRLLREPVGRIHWAGTETAGTSYGAIDGAVRSGERVAAEILNR
jgi:monoamine oxidase